jgi:hypothetical protein
MYQYRKQNQRETPRAKNQPGFTVFTMLGVLGALGALGAGCESPATSSTKPPAARELQASPTRNAPTPTRTFSHNRKTTAPVDVTLTRSDTKGPVKLTLTFTARANLPRAVARFAIPDSLEVLQGQRQVDFGAVRRGERRDLSLTLSVPPRRFLRLGAGVDVHLTSGVKLHKGKTLTFGSPPARDDTEVVHLPGNTHGVRVQHVGAK